MKEDNLFSNSMFVPTLKELDPQVFLSARFVLVLVFEIQLVSSVNEHRVGEEIKGFHLV